MTKKNGPWIIKASEQKYKNPWLEVVEDQVVRPDGTEGIYGGVKIKEGISVLPILRVIDPRDFQNPWDLSRGASVFGSTEFPPQLPDGVR